MVEPHRLADWRIGISGEVAKDAGEFRAGEIVYFSTEIATSRHGTIRLPIPSPVRLAFSVAVRAARLARDRRKQADFLTKPGRKLLAMDPSSLAYMYDYFEECMVAVLFSHLALEAHANDLIGRLARDQTVELERRGGKMWFNADELQRNVSTEEKLSTVLPTVIGIPIQKSGKVWRDFKILQRMRDAVTHFKSREHTLRGGKVDRETVFFRLFDNSPLLYPRAALAVIAHFKEYNTHELVDHLEQTLAE